MVTLVRLHQNIRRVYQLLRRRHHLLVLDEPTVGLDGRGMAQLLAWLSDLRAAGTTIILITHEMDLALRADRLIAMERGRVTADGDPTAVLAHDPAWSRVL